MSPAVRLRGLPFRVEEQDIRAFFHSDLRDRAPKFHIVHVSIECGPDGRPNGDALVEFASEMESERALSYDRQMMGQRYIEVIRASRNNVDHRMAGSRPPWPPQSAPYRDGGEDPSRQNRGRRSRSRSRSRSRKEPQRRSRSREKPRQPEQGRERKSASPPPKKKEKKKSNWDAPPTAVGEGGANNPQLTYKARRIYVGNLPLDPPITDVALREFIDQAMHQAGLSSGPGCCVSDVWISTEKNFAFVEVRTVLEANNAMTLDGITLYGCPLRINRPHDYVPPAADLVAAGIVAIPGTALPTAPGVNLGTLMQITKKCRRVHIGNLPAGLGLSPSALKQFVSQLMQQLKLTVKPGDPVVDAFVSGDGKFGFVEMRTIAEANNALSMGGIDFMGRPIRVGRPADYAPPTPEMIMQCEGTGILGTPGDFGVTEFVIPGAAAGIGEPDLAAATTVVVIENMLSEKELQSDSECADISEDTISKCEEDFGPVRRMVIARPGRAGVPDAAAGGRVFVQFRTVEDAKKAAVGLNRVKFDDRTVRTSFGEEGIMEELALVYPEQVRD